MLKTAGMLYKQPGTNGKVHVTVPKRPRPIMAEMTGDVLSNSREQTLDVPMQLINFTFTIWRYYGLFEWERERERERESCIN